MHDSTRLSPQQRTLPFSRPEVWEQLPDEARCRCQELCAQLLRVVLEPEEERRGEYEREDQL